MILDNPKYVHGAFVDASGQCTIVFLDKYL